MRLCLCALALFMSMPAVAQRVGFGPKLGVPLRAPYPAGLGDDSPRLTAGQFIDVRLAGPLSLEFNPMWRRVGFDFSREFPGNPFRSTTRIVDLPVLARLTASRGSAIRPFVSGGYLRRYYSNTISGAFMSPRTLSGWSHGWAGGAGVSFAAGRIRIEPEYRYSNAWKADGGRYGAHDLLVGFRFGGRAGRP
jgi:opacity protein-like surface antigen